MQHVAACLRPQGPCGARKQCQRSTGERSRATMRRRLEQKRYDQETGLLHRSHSQCDRLTQRLCFKRRLRAGSMDEVTNQTKEGCITRKASIRLQAIKNRGAGAATAANFAARSEARLPRTEGSGNARCSTEINKTRIGFAAALTQNASHRNKARGGATCNM